MKAVVTIETTDAESKKRLKARMAVVHGKRTPLEIALRDEIKSWLQVESGAELTVEVKVEESDASK